MSVEVYATWVSEIPRLLKTTDVNDLFCINFARVTIVKVDQKNNFIIVNLQQRSSVL